MKFTTYRFINIYAAFIVLLLLIGASYMQFQMNLPPCPLCVMQRLIFAVLGLFFVTGAIYIPRVRGRKIINSVIIGISILGIAIASRHVYLQHQPVGTGGSCGPGLNFIFNNLSPGDALRMLFLGSGECSKIHWNFLGFTIPEWSLFFFILFAVVGVFQYGRKVKD